MKNQTIILKKTPVILHMCTINGNYMIYGSWNMERDWQNFLSFWTIFLRFYPTNNPKKIFWAKEKNSGDIIILHMCTIKDNEMIYSSWDMEFDGHIFLWFSTLFFPFTHLKNQNFEKMKKKHLEILSFCTCVPHMTSTRCTVPEIWSAMDIIFCHFGSFSAH